MEYLCDHQHQLYPISMPDKAELRLSDGFNLFNFAKIDRGMVECGVVCAEVGERGSIGGVLLVSRLLFSECSFSPSLS